MKMNGNTLVSRFLHISLSIIRLHHVISKTLSEISFLKVEFFEEMIQNVTISKSNTFGLIRKLGAETSGVLSFRAPGSEPRDTSFLTPVPDDELIEQLERNLAQLVYWDGKVRLSVAGVQNKLNLL